VPSWCPASRDFVPELALFFVRQRRFDTPDNPLGATPEAFRIGSHSFVELDEIFIEIPE
jgi:hypothetical protein